jgi:hypothetical protein
MLRIAWNTIDAGGATSLAVSAHSHVIGLADAVTAKLTEEISWIFFVNFSQTKFQAIANEAN